MCSLTDYANDQSIQDDSGKMMSVKIVYFSLSPNIYYLETVSNPFLCVYKIGPYQ